jgi:hypothetical protein
MAGGESTLGWRNPGESTSRTGNLSRDGGAAAGTAPRGGCREERRSGAERGSVAYRLGTLRFKKKPPIMYLM